MDIVYSQTRQPGGRRQINPRFFTGPLPDVTTVYLDGDWPRIAEAYEREGVKVLRLDAAPVAPVEPDAQLVEPVFIPADWRELGWSQPVFIPADWRELGWSQPDERGLTLRSLASQVSEAPILNKRDAVAAVETYLGVSADADV